MVVLAAAALPACGRVDFDRVSNGGGLDAAIDAGRRDGGVVGDGMVVPGSDSGPDPDAGPLPPLPDGGSSEGTTGFVGGYGSIGSDQGYDVVAGADRKINVVGTFQASFAFGTEGVSSRGGTDGFIARFDAAGVPQWAVGIGGAGSDRAQGVDVDPVGRPYVAGLFEGTVDFGGGMVETAGGMTDAFVAAYDFDGTLRWVRTWGAAGADFAYDVAIDPTGDVLVTGYYEGAIDVEGEPLEAFGDRDVFLVRFTRDGALLWARGWGSAGLDSGQGVAATAGGAAIVTGGITGPVDFGTGPIDAAGGSFLLEVALDGGATQATPIPGVTSWDVDVHRPTGRMLVGARASAGTDLGMGALTTRGGTDALVLSYTSDHALDWYTVYGGTLDDLGLGITTDAAGNVYMIGLGGADVDFGRGEIAGNGDQDIFVASHDPDGLPRWGRLFGGAVQDRGYGVTVAPSGSVWITGRHSGPSDFGTADPFPTFGGDDVFLVRLD